MIHNHGTEDGPGLACSETRLPDGTLRGACMPPLWMMVEGSIPVFINEDVYQLIGYAIFTIDDSKPEAVMTISLDKDMARLFMRFLMDQKKILGVSFVSIPVNQTT